MQTAKYQPWLARWGVKGLFSALVFFETATTAGLCSPTGPPWNHVNAIKFLGTIRIATSQLALRDGRENYVQELEIHILGKSLGSLPVCAQPGIIKTSAAEKGSVQQKQKQLSASSQSSKDRYKWLLSEPLSLFLFLCGVWQKGSMGGSWEMWFPLCFLHMLPCRMACSVVGNASDVLSSVWLWEISKYHLKKKKKCLFASLQPIDLLFVAIEVSGAEAEKIRIKVYSQAWMLLYS